MSARKEGATLHAVKTAWWAKQLWLVHLAGNAGILALVYAWLWVPEAKLWQVALSAIIAVSIALTTVWLHGATVNFLHARHTGIDAKLAQAFRTAWPRIPALLVWLVIYGLALWLLAAGREQTQLWAGVTASWLTLKLQKPVSPATTFQAYSWLLWILRWVAVPVVLLPVGVRAALAGFEAFRWSSLRRGWRTFQRARAWLLYLGVLLIGLLLPDWIASWVPKVQGIGIETASMVIRFGVAYVLAVVSWLVLLSLLAQSAGENGEPLRTRERAEAAPSAANSTASAGAE
jgi:hypothetical protein